VSLLFVVQGKNYAERACCDLDLTVSSDTCATNPLPTVESTNDDDVDNLTAIIVGVAVGAVAATLLVTSLLYFFMRRKSSRKTLILHHVSFIDESVSVIAPPEDRTPSAPPFNPAFTTTEEA
jgi:hypothetical protein